MPVKIVETIGKTIDMGNEDDNEIYDLADAEDWLNSDTFTTPNYEWFGSGPTNYSDIETWLLEKSIEATSDKHLARRTQAKRELYLLKCKIERIYDSIPKDSVQERDWDKEEVHRILKEGK